ncbi:UNVERIFIED_CONTAM: hypothetical protein FKN15_048673 [Acipenser sinensis]
MAPPLLALGAAAAGEPAGMLPLLVAAMEEETAGNLPLLVEVAPTPPSRAVDVRALDVRAPPTRAVDVQAPPTRAVDVRAPHSTGRDRRQTDVAGYRGGTTVVTYSSSADAINNAAGYGFNGIDTQGQFRWDLISNLNIWNIETATSFKMYIDNWNIQTAAWLKRVCYDRVGGQRSSGQLTGKPAGDLPVYMGYWCAMRNNFRHHFLSSRTKKFIYDIITWAVTQLSICYTVAPFLLLAVEPTFKFYKSMFFCFHILSILVLLVLPIKPNTVKSQVHTSSNNKENGYNRALN